MIGVPARLGWLVNVAAIAVLGSAAADALAEPATNDADLAAATLWRAGEARATALLEMRVIVDANADREADCIALSQTHAEQALHQQTFRALVNQSTQLSFDLRHEIDRMTTRDRFAGFVLDRSLIAKQHELVMREQISRLVDRTLERLGREPPCGVDQHDLARLRLQELRDQQRALQAALAARRREPQPPPLHWKISKDCLEHAICRDP